MKKSFILAAAAVAALASCSKEVSLQQTAPAADNAVAFSAYTLTPATKGTVQEKKDIVGVAGGATGDGIGVFAFYQSKEYGNLNLKKELPPYFMFNQQVTSTDGGSKWSYTPVKYWPNNEGDKLSFFAYAPWKDGKTWEDMGISTDINATKMSLSFPINDEVNDQVDYLWADPIVNQTKPSYDAKLKFAFSHICAQINLWAAAELDAVNRAPLAWADSKTTITIEKVEFKGLAKSIDYEYTLPTGTSVTTTFSGSQDIVLTAANDFTDNTSAAWSNSEYHQFNKTSSVMFVAPQQLDRVFITYTVETKVNDTSESANDSKITNVIETNLNTINLEKGKAYDLKFLIGMTSVKVTATVGEWNTATVEKADVPANTSGV